MIVQTIQRNVVESHDFKSEIATIDASEMRYVSSLLRNNYSDPILATVREIVANAVDANNASGTQQSVEIFCPTRIDPEFRVRDFGLGLSEKDLFGMYTKYGRSTKRGENSSIGGFGIGRFAPLSYSDSFTVSSFFNGTEIIISVFVDEHGDTRFVKLGEVETSEPNGLKISVSVKQKDFTSFEAHISRILLFSSHKFNCLNFKRNEPLWLLKNDSWGILGDNSQEYTYTNGGLASCLVMGGISYPINFDLLKQDPLFNKCEFFDALQSSYNRVVFFVPIGSVSIHHSRESLEYNATTKRFLKELFRLTEIDFKSQIQKELDSIHDSEKFFQKLKNFEISLLRKVSANSCFDFISADGKKVSAQNVEDENPYCFRRSSQTGNGVRLLKRKPSFSPIIFYCNPTTILVVDDGCKHIEQRVRYFYLNNSSRSPTIFVVSEQDAKSKFLIDFNSCDRVLFASKMTRLEKPKGQGKTTKQTVGRVVYRPGKDYYQVHGESAHLIPDSPFYYIKEDVDLSRKSLRSRRPILHDLFNQSFHVCDLHKLANFIEKFGHANLPIYLVNPNSVLPDYAVDFSVIFKTAFVACSKKFETFCSSVEERDYRRSVLTRFDLWQEISKLLPQNHIIDLFCKSAQRVQENVPAGEKQLFDVFCDLPIPEKIHNGFSDTFKQKVDQEALTITSKYRMLDLLLDNSYIYTLANHTKDFVNYINLIDKSNS